MISPDKILADLAKLLADFQGREYSGTIDRTTLFFADLGFASIDAIVLGETLEAFYAQKLPFNAFLASAGRSGSQDISVGELVDFLAGYVH